MGLLDRIGAFLKREAKDLGEVAEWGRDKLDEELSEREAELEMTPAERIEAIQQEAAQADRRFDDIFGKVADRRAPADGVGGTQSGELPEVTSITLADGTTRSGNDPGPSDDPAGDSPQEGELGWVAPGEGDDAVVPAFGGDGADDDPGDAEPAEPPIPDLPALEVPPSPQEPLSEAHERWVSKSESPPPPTPDPSQLPVAPPADAGEGADDTPVAVVDPPAVENPDRRFDKTPAQIKYEQARADADALLEELRGELRDDGEI